MTTTCAACADTGVCQACDGAGCKDCWNTGECPWCEPEPFVAATPPSLHPTIAGGRLAAGGERC
jgi:hypothetical protein